MIRYVERSNFIIFQNQRCLTEIFQITVLLNKFSLVEITLFNAFIDSFFYYAINGINFLSMPECGTDDYNISSRELTKWKNSQSRFSQKISRILSKV